MPLPQVSAKNVDNSLAETTARVVKASPLHVRKLHPSVFFDQILVALVRSKFNVRSCDDKRVVTCCTDRMLLTISVHIPLVYSFVHLAFIIIDKLEAAKALAHTSAHKHLMLDSLDVAEAVRK